MDLATLLSRRHRMDLPRLSEPLFRRLPLKHCVGTTHNKVSPDEGYSPTLNGMSSKSTILKLPVLGDGGVGKSALINRYVNNSFEIQSFHTIGVDFLMKDISYGNKVYTFQLWDTAGQERYRSLRTPFYRGSDACILVFSLEDRHSFNNLSTWRSEFIHYADVHDPDGFIFMVLGNKVDTGQREVSEDEAQLWCQKNGGIPYFETSAKKAINVDSAFQSVVERYVHLERAPARALEPPISLDSSRQSRKSPASFCC